MVPEDPIAKNGYSFDTELSLSSKQGDKKWAKIMSKRESKGMFLYVSLPQQIHNAHKLAKVLTLENK
jgi:hypothetical protein